MSQSFKTAHVACTSQHHFYKWNQRKWLRTSFLLLRDYTFNTREQNVFDKIYIRSDLRSKFPQWKCPPCVLVLVLWASVALLFLDRFHFFFIFWFILFCLNSSILLPQRFCCFFHLKTFEIVFTSLSMYRLSGGEKHKIFVNSLSQGFKHILWIRENCTHSSNKGENCDFFISSTKNVHGFY